MFCQIGLDWISIWCVAVPSSKQQLDGAQPHVSRLPIVCHTLAGSIWRHLGKQVIKAAFCQSAFTLMWAPSGNEHILWAPFNPIIPRDPDIHGPTDYERCVTESPRDRGQDDREVNTNTHTVLKIAHFILKEAEFGMMTTNSRTRQTGVHHGKASKIIEWHNQEVGSLPVKLCLLWISLDASFFRINSSSHLYTRYAFYSLKKITSKRKHVDVKQRWWRRTEPWGTPHLIQE